MIAAARRISRRIVVNRRGAALVEFAIVAPVLMILLMGLFDLMYQVYAQSILEGAVQKAGRDAAIEGGGDRGTELDERVFAMVRSIARNATYEANRKNYASLSHVKPEPFTDGNENGIRDPKECFEDVNGNGRWDSDPGAVGQGGANDATLYTFELTYPRLFPVAGLMGLEPTNKLTAQTLLKNQPFARQVVGTVKTICP